MHSIQTENLDQELIDTLLTIPTLNNKEERNVLLFGLPNDIVVSLPRSANNTIVDTINIITTLSALGMLSNGEWPLIKVIRNAIRLAGGSHTELAHILQNIKSKYEDLYSLQPKLEKSEFPEVVIGIDARLPVSFLGKGAEAQKSVARLLVSRFDNGKKSEQKSTGTGWLITNQLLVTNYHVIEARYRALGEPAASLPDIQHQTLNTMAWFGYDNDNSQHTDYKVIELVHASSDLDYAILRLSPSSSGLEQISLESWGYLKLISLKQNLAKGDRLNIIQHPLGEPKRLAIRENFYMSEDSDHKQKNRIQYITDTEPGSSGSPVFNDNWEVIALHRASIQVPEEIYRGTVIKYNNQGVDIHAIYNDLIPVVRAEIDAFQNVETI